TATVSVVAPGAGSPTGTVTFMDGAATLGTGTLSGGVATLSTTALTVVSHSLSAAYGGGTNYQTSSGSLTQSFHKASTTTSLVSPSNPSLHGDRLTLTATVSVVAPGAGSPTATVTFKDGLTTLGTGNVDGTGKATLQTSALAVGGHSITAS